MELFAGAQVSGPSEEFLMLEVAAALVVFAVALTFVKDATSATIKLARSNRQRGAIRVAEPHLSQD